MSNRQKIDIEKLLNGTGFESVSGRVAQIAADKNMDDEVSIQNLPRLGKVAGQDVYALLKAINTAIQTSEAEPPEERGEVEEKPAKKTTRKRRPKKDSTKES